MSSARAPPWRWVAPPCRGGGICRHGERDGGGLYEFIYSFYSIYYYIKLKIKKFEFFIIYLENNYFRLF